MSGDREILGRGVLTCVVDFHQRLSTANIIACKRGQEGGLGGGRQVAVYRGVAWCWATMRAGGGGSAPPAGTRGGARLVLGSQAQPRLRARAGVPGASRGLTWSGLSASVAATRSQRFCGGSQTTPVSRSRTITWRRARGVQGGGRVAPRLQRSWGRRDYGGRGGAGVGGVGLHGSRPGRGPMGWDQPGCAQAGGCGGEPL
jgi:hypothetical protein